MKTNSLIKKASKIQYDNRKHGQGNTQDKKSEYWLKWNRLKITS